MRHNNGSALKQQISDDDLQAAAANEYQRHIEQSIESDAVIMSEEEKYAVARCITIALKHPKNIGYIAQYAKQFGIRLRDRLPADIDSPEFDADALRHNTAMDSIAMAKPESYAVIMCIQLAVKRLGIFSRTAQVAQQFGVRLQNRVFTEKTPALRMLAEAGWGNTTTTTTS